MTDTIANCGCPDGTFPVEYQEGDTVDSLAHKAGMLPENFPVRRDPLNGDILFYNPETGEPDILPDAGDCVCVEGAPLPAIVIPEPIVETEQPPCSYSANPSRPLDGIYTLRTMDDLLQAVWQSHCGGNLENYNPSCAESCFRDVFVTAFHQTLNSVLENVYFAEAFDRLQGINNIHLFVTDNDIQRWRMDRNGNAPWTPTPYSMIGLDAIQAGINQLSVEQIIQLYQDLISFHIEGTPEVYSNQAAESIVNAFLYVYAWELNIELPFDPYANFDPNLATEDWLLQQVGGVGNEVPYAEEYVRNTLISHIANIMMAMQQGFGYVPPDTDFTDYLALLRAIDANLELHELVAMAENIAERVRELCPEDGSPCLTESPDPSQQGLDTHLSEVERLTGGYHHALAYDQMRQILYDPTWHPIHTEQQLSDLSAAIMEMPTHIVDVDVRFARAGMQHYLNIMRRFHEWRNKVKPGFDYAERIMLQHRAENGLLFSPFVWMGLLLVQVGLSVIFEPLDWVFTAVDLMRGDWLALVGLLPLVPSTMDNLGRLAGQLGNIQDLSDFRHLMSGYDIGEKALQASWSRFDLDQLEEVTEAARTMDVLEGRGLMRLIDGKYVPFDEISNLSETPEFGLYPIK